MNVIGISGKARSGKDTTANFLRDKYGFVVVHFADALYKEAQEVYKYCTPVDGDHNIEEYTGVRLENGDVVPVPASFHSSLLREGMKQKDGNFLQWWGTIRRNHFNRDYWVERVEDTLANLEAEGVQNVVVADVRLLNEANFIKGVGGQLLRVMRYGPDGAMFIDPSRDPKHESEVELDDYQDFDAILINLHDIQFLCDSAEELLFKLLPDMTCSLS